MLLLFCSQAVMILILLAISCCSTAMVMNADSPSEWGESMAVYGLFTRDIQSERRPFAWYPDKVSWAILMIWTQYPFVWNMFWILILRILHLFWVEICFLIEPTSDFKKWSALRPFSNAWGSSVVICLLFSSYLRFLIGICAPLGPGEPRVS